MSALEGKYVVPSELLQKDIRLSSVISCAKGIDCDDDDVRDHFPCIYAASSDGLLSLDMTCCLDSYPNVVNDKEMYTDFVKKKKLHIIYYGQQFIDVISSVVDQRPAASLENFLSALNYYRENDDFLDF